MYVKFYAIFAFHMLRIASKKLKTSFIPQQSKEVCLASSCETIILKAIISSLK